MRRAGFDGEVAKFLAAEKTDAMYAGKRIGYFRGSSAAQGSVEDVDASGVTPEEFYDLGYVENEGAVTGSVTYPDAEKKQQQICFHRKGAARCKFLAARRCTLAPTAPVERLRRSYNLRPWRKVTGDGLHFVRRDDPPAREGLFLQRRNVSNKYFLKVFFISMDSFPRR